MIAFFLRQLFRIFRLLMVILPVLGIVYSFSFIALTIEIIAGENVLSSMLPLHLESTSVKSVILDTLSGYLHLLSEYGGTLTYFILFLFMLILAVPITFVFIAAGNFVYLGKYSVFVIAADLVVYFIHFIIFKKTPLEVIKSRYRKFFPSAGRKLNQRSYEKWLERHHEEFENDTFGQPAPRNSYDDFYREDRYDQYDDEYEEEYYNDRLDESDDEYLEARYEYEDEYDDEPDSYLEDKYYKDPEPEPHRRSRFLKKSSPEPSFNFFAGCTTLDSANKKYKSLVKLYHPDNMDGDTSALQEINIQYNEIKKRLG